MAGIARILPRDWDGGRLLRFLAGLALIALSFAVHLGVGDPATTHHPAAATVADAVATRDTAIPDRAIPDRAGQDPSLQDPGSRDPGSRDSATQDPATLAVAGPAFVAQPPVAGRPRSAALPAGATQGVLGSRAPPRR